MVAALDHARDAFARGEDVEHAALHLLEARRGLKDRLRARALLLHPFELPGPGHILEPEDGISCAPALKAAARPRFRRWQLFMVSSSPRPVQQFTTGTVVASTGWQAFARSPR
jgi:hypothetical protein